MKPGKHASRCFSAIGILPILLLCANTHGSNYYIDPIKGDDGGTGDISSPWRSFRNVISYYKPDYRPPGWVQLKGGDCIYLAGGRYSETFHPGQWKKGPTGGGSFIAYFRGLKADKDNPFRIEVLPGQKAVIDPNGRGIGLSIFQSSNWRVEGIEVANAYGRGISLNESQEIRISNSRIRDTDGVDNNNIAGLYITDCWNVEIHDSIFNDNYDRTCADTAGRATENSTNVVIFGGMRGGNITIRNCLIYQSLPLSDKLSGGGIKYKHASRVPGSYFRVYENVFKNCKFFAFGSGTANTHFHHNIIARGSGISSRDFGGVTHQTNQVFEYNTIYNAPGFHMNPTTRWRNEKFPDDPKGIVFRNNIVVDSAGKYSFERGMVAIGTYMPDDTYEIIVGQLKFENNCYFNPRLPVQFNIAAGFNYRDGYQSGNKYSLKQWQEKFGYDAGSIEANPLFVDADRADFTLRPDSPSRNMGRYAGVEKQSSSISR
ncbi:MAG: right-handed parallel beta-helix repeat-containing protein [Planctomycetota bacterium]|jgi:hypothetical protein